MPQEGDFKKNVGFRQEIPTKTFRFPKFSLGIGPDIAYHSKLTDSTGWKARGCLCQNFVLLPRSPGDPGDSSHSPDPSLRIGVLSRARRENNREGTWLGSRARSSRRYDPTGNGPQTGRFTRMKMDADDSDVTTRPRSVALGMNHEGIGPRPGRRRRRLSGRNRVRIIIEKSPRTTPSTCTAEERVS